MQCGGERWQHYVVDAERRVGREGVWGRGEKSDGSGSAGGVEREVTTTENAAAGGTLKNM